jgi:hypothetical protein
MKKIILFSAFVLGAVCVPSLVSAQPLPPTGPPCWPPPCVPIDGGLSFLIVAGVAYGGKKLHDFKKGAETNKAE